jgi:hypothetical protein
MNDFEWLRRLYLAQARQWREAALEASHKDDLTRRQGVSDGFTLAAEMIATHQCVESMDSEPPSNWSGLWIKTNTTNTWPLDKVCRIGSVK